MKTHEIVFDCSSVSICGIRGFICGFAVILLRPALSFLVTGKLRGHPANASKADEPRLHRVANFQPRKRPLSLIRNPSAGPQVSSP
jgi:hypothetical protein